ncbi:MAG TPA: glycosyltransferase family 4 protein [Sphingomicrobium sp.]|nr:glycosyltransferase family 4 protein [Sphingomicrobium sp.]
MRLLFAHDHRFFRGPAGKMYTTGALPAALWERYLEHFEEVHVVARDEGNVPEGMSLGRSDRDRVGFEFLPSLSSLRQLILRSPELERRMHDAVASADAVVARLPSEIGHLAVRHAKALGKPYAVEVVGCAWDGYFNNGAPAARLYAPLALMRARKAVGDAPLALYVTSSWLQNRYPTSGFRASASNVQVRPMTAAEDERRDTRLAALSAGEKPVLGTIASLRIKSKGIQTALAALGRLRSEGLDCTYRVLGAGPVEPWRQLAQIFGLADHVHFDGTRSAGDDVLAWLDGIDIHLQPSFQEGLPRSTIEAMSRGCACIGSTCGGIPELLPARRVHRPGDVAGLQARIRSLTTDPPAIAEASRADRTTAGDYDSEILKGRRSAFYAELRKMVDERRVKS